MTDPVIRIRFLEKFLGAAARRRSLIRSQIGLDLPANRRDPNRGDLLSVDELAFINRYDKPMIKTTRANVPRSTSGESLE